MQNDHHFAFCILHSALFIEGGSKYAERGALIGLIAGIFLTPIGMVMGSFLGAFLAEMYWGGQKPEGALKAATGSFIGFILLIIKLFDSPKE